MILIGLYLLATVDGALCGVRSAAGRSALIHKRRFYIAAMARGALWAQVASLIAGIGLIVVLRLAPGRETLLRDLVEAARRMMWVLVPYAIVIFGSFLVRWFPSTDIRSATSVMIFGPMTAARPLVAIAAVLYGIVPATRWEVRGLGLFILGLMFAVQWKVEWDAERRMNVSPSGVPRAAR